jgi:hypothetical protein
MSDAFEQFTSQFKDTSFRPDITGYVLIYLVPPVFMGNSTIGGDYCPLLAIDFSPPETTVKSSDETSNAAISIPYSTGTSSGGQLSINYMEDHKLSVVKYHNEWVRHISDVVYGEKEPSAGYASSGKLDYATSAYIVKFKPDMCTMVYVGKATGIFPINIPAKEVIGTRQANELTMVGCNYSCAMYTAYVAGGVNSWVYSNFKSDLQTFYKVDMPDCSDHYSENKGGGGAPKIPGIDGPVGGAASASAGDAIAVVNSVAEAVASRNADPVGLLQSNLSHSSGVSI